MLITIFMSFLCNPIHLPRAWCASHSPPQSPNLLHLEFPFNMPSPFSVPSPFSLGLLIRSLLEVYLTHTVALDTAVDAILELYTRIEVEIESDFIGQK